MWVLFTLVDSARVVYRKYVREHRAATRRRALWDDYRVVGRLFGLRDADMPATLDDARRLPPRDARRRPAVRERVGAQARAQDRARAAGAASPGRWSRRSTSSRSRCCPSASARSTASHRCRRSSCGKALVAGGADVREAGRDPLHARPPALCAGRARRLMEMESPTEGFAELALKAGTNARLGFVGGSCVSIDAVRRYDLERDEHGERLTEESPRRYEAAPHRTECAVGAARSES